MFCIALQSLQITLRNCRVQINVDSQVPLDTLRSNAISSPRCWQKVQEQFGGVSRHTMKLMALDFNTQRSLNVTPLPHISLFPTALSCGVNLLKQNPLH